MLPGDEVAPHHLDRQIVCSTSGKPEVGAGAHMIDDHFLRLTAKAAMAWGWAAASALFYRANKISSGELCVARLQQVSKFSV